MPQGQLRSLTVNGWAAAFLYCWNSIGCFAAVQLL